MTIEVPYLFIQALVFEMITYPMIGYYGSAYKVLWYFYAMFCTQLYFTFFGMLFVSLTPDVTIAGALSSFFYPMLNLFSGFLIPPLVSHFYPLKSHRKGSKTHDSNYYEIFTWLALWSFLCRKSQSGGSGCIT